MTFIPEETYAKLVHIGPEEKIRLYQEARELWLEQWTELSCIKKTGDLPIRVACIGYGSGWRDLPFLIALRDILKEKAESSALQPRPIHVYAIEPSWCKQEEYSERELSWGSPLCDTPSNPTVARTGTGSGIRIDLFKCTVEAWQRNTPADCLNVKWDAVIAFNVLQLLDDWKNSLAYFLKNLKAGGVLMVSETKDTVSAFEGSFRYARRSEDEDPWDHVWRMVYEIRDNLLVPGTRIVAPRDLTFLNESLIKAGFEHPRQRTVLVKSTITGRDLKIIIESVRDGSDAQTFEALRINDNDRARKFTDEAGKDLADWFEKDTYEFQIGHRFLFYIKPKKELEFPINVALCAMKHATNEAIERKSSIKRVLAGTKNKSNSSAHTEAVASILYDMREALALSRDTMIVMTSKDEGKIHRVVQLVPLSIVGSTDRKQELALKYINRVAIYLSDPPDRHLAHIFDTKMGDLVIEIIASTESLSNQYPSISVGFGADGKPTYIKLEISETTFLDYRDELRRKLGGFFDKDAALSLGPDALPDWNNDKGFLRFYMEARSAHLTQSVASLRKPTGEFFLDEFREVTKRFVDTIRDKIISKLQISGLKKGDVEVLTAPLSNSLRLGLMEWGEDNERLSWRSCVYIMRKTTGESGSTGASLLMLLSDSDYEAWRDASASFSHPLDKSTSSPLPLLVAAVEPFVNAIQELENAELAKHKGAMEQRYLFAHDALGMIQTILFDVNFSKLTQPTQDIAKLLYLDIFLWKSKSIRLSPQHESLDLEQCARLARRLAWRHLVLKELQMKMLQKGMTEDEERQVKLNLKNILSNLEQEEMLFSDKKLFTHLNGGLETKWAGIITSVIICALRQSLCHSVISAERLKIKGQTSSNYLHNERILADDVQGVRFIVEERCLDPFALDTTTEGEKIIRLVEMTSESPDPLKLCWESLLDSDGMYLCTLIITDPTGRILPDE